MRVSLHMRKVLVLLNLGKFDEFNEAKKSLCELMEKAKRVAEETHSESKEKEPKKGEKLKMISLEKLEQIQKNIESDWEKIQERMDKADKKKKADLMLRNKNNLEEAKLMYTEILESDAENVKSS